VILADKNGRVISIQYGPSVAPSKQCKEFKLIDKVTSEISRASHTTPIGSIRAAAPNTTSISAVCHPNLSVTASPCSLQVNRKLPVANVIGSTGMLMYAY